MDVFPDDLLQTLLRESEQTRVIDLDHFADAAAPFGLGADQLDALIDALEKEGRQVKGDDSIRLREELALVLPRARAFVAENGRRPSVEELAALAGTSAVVVRRALAFGRLISR